MYKADIKKLTKENTNFRRVLHTGEYSQIVAMNIPVGQDIGMEVHKDTDQIIFIIEGEAEATINDESKRIGEHDVVYIPSGSNHNIKNIDDEDLKLFTVYSPPEHPEGTVHKTKVDALKSESEL